MSDKPAVVKMAGDPVHVAAGRIGVGENAARVVDFWAEGAGWDDPDTRVPRTFQVFGTGHPLPEGARWWGTTPRCPDGLVWHLYELPGGPS
ncbi:hypothetical protein [Sphaerisporangium sp. TRM90804]|uniref:DUF7352 domain-containing protein n=1 Tax=Sphaerisporangium sp. TRM90804 TaxID=3031113 RepID=UPI002446C463|nr:hypothetical protein [Sphaerisporangium sp. TRM90804]MDH2425783.1 hypothetical protein [Sphaerisporangium sp. TRM90804]